MRLLLSGVLILLTCFEPCSSFADEPEEAQASARSVIRLAPMVSTVFPIFLGGGAGVSLWSHLQVSLQYGVTPRPYYLTIGQVASDLGNNASYKNVISAAFAGNHSWRAGIDYSFKEEGGWKFGFALSFLSASGVSSINDTLGAATGRDFTNLSNALAARGRSSEISLESDLKLAEFHVGYGFALGSGFVLDTSLGVAKIVASEISLKTGLPNFEASNIGNTLLRESESDLERILLDYGIAPTLAVRLAYWF